MQVATAQAGHMGVATQGGGSAANVSCGSGMAMAGTEFTGFTSTQVQTLTQRLVQEYKY